MARLRSTTKGRAASNKRETLPVLPLRDAVHFPGVLTTLHVVREQSIAALSVALGADKRIVALSQLDMSEDNPGTLGLHLTGTVDEILQATNMPDGSVRLIMRGLERCRAVELSPGPTLLRATIEIAPSCEGDGPEFAALVAEVRDTFCRLAPLLSSVPPEAAQSVSLIESPCQLADTACHYLSLNLMEKQHILEQLSVQERLRTLLQYLTWEEQSQKLRADLRARTAAAIGGSQREFFLRQQLKNIQSELNSGGATRTEMFEAKLQNLKIPDSSREYTQAQIDALGRSPEDSQEASVYIRQIEALLNFPWFRSAPERLDLADARAVLDEDHFGLEGAKERILEFLAVRKLTNGQVSPALCFVGPAGVGKTTLARSIAAVLNRPLVPIALGGVRDEAELRGHRRTYVGAQPGRIAQGLISCGFNNPVVVLDELDKVSYENSRSDVAAALLQILDPASNREFRDSFLEVSIDLHDVLFIATANSLNNIPLALQDRLEIVEFSSYSLSEKFQIASQYLLPKALRASGLMAKDIVIQEPLDELIRNYATGGGVRELERLLNKLCRKAAFRKASGKGPLLLKSDTVQSILGQPRCRQNRPGTVAALAVTELGGALFYIEAEFLARVGDSPSFTLTGSMGEIMRESAEAAVSFLRSRRVPELEERWFDKDIHIHAHEGALIKEGPSAGLAIVLALYGKLTGHQMPNSVAVTGEITLSGQVLQVGGICEKLLAAQRHGIESVILPRVNLVEVQELPADTRRELKLIPVDTVAEAFESCFRPLARS